MTRATSATTGIRHVLEDSIGVDSIYRPIREVEVMDVAVLDFNRSVVRGESVDWQYPGTGSAFFGDTP